ANQRPPRTRLTPCRASTTTTSASSSLELKWLVSGGLLRCADDSSPLFVPQQADIRAASMTVDDTADLIVVGTGVPDQGVDDRVPDSVVITSAERESAAQDGCCFTQAVFRASGVPQQDGRPVVRCRTR